MAQNRNKYLDEVKGIAAILVVYGHTIQYGNGANYLMNKYFYSNIIKLFTVSICHYLR